MRRPSRPEALSVVAFAVGWVGVYFAFRDHWLGILLPLLTTVLTLLVVRRVEALGRPRRRGGGSVGGRRGAARGGERRRHLRGRRGPVPPNRRCDGTAEYHARTA